MKGVTIVTNARHLNTDSENTTVIAAVPDVPPSEKAPAKSSGVPPLSFLAVVVFLASVNAALWMSQAPVPFNVAVTGTSAALLLLVASNGIAFTRGKR